MTLAGLRALFLDMVFDDGVGWPPAKANGLLNAAMQHVANAIAGQRADEMVEVREFALPDAGGRVMVAVDASAWTYPRIRRVLALWGRDEGSNIPIGEQITFAAGSNYMAAADQTEPRFLLGGESLYLMQPPAGADFSLTYVPGLPNMAVDGDSPGQANGVGTADKIPLNFQPLIAAYAALLATGSAERTPAEGPLAIVAGMQQAVGLELMAKKVRT